MFNGDQFASSGHAFGKHKFPNKDSEASDAMKRLGGVFDTEKFIVPTVSSPSMIIDDKPVLHPAPHVQDAFALTSATGEPAIATKEEGKAAKKLFANGKNTPLTLYAVGVGFFALVMMLRVC